MAEQSRDTDSLEAQDPLSAEDILALCANRFNGYDYLRGHPGFHPESFVDHFFSTGTWHGTDNELQAQLFLLHRSLGK